MNMNCLGPLELVVVKQKHLSTYFAPRLHLPNPDHQSPKRLLHHRICSARPALHRLLINHSSHNYLITTTSTSLIWRERYNTL